MVGANAALSGFREHPSRSDWYVVPKEWLPRVASAPAVQVDRRFGPIVHRSHLPLLRDVFPVELPLPNYDRAALDAETERLGWKLREYQHVGREFIVNRRGTLLADQMRLGKTCTVVAAHDPATGPLMVVAPLPTREVWLSWFRRRWPDVKPIVLTGRKLAGKRREYADFIVLQELDAQLLQSAPVIFCHYDVLSAWKFLSGLDHRLGTLVFDEAHLLSNRKTQRSQAAVILSARAARVVAVTGTPLWNHPAGLYTILSCINPGAWGTYYEFAVRYGAGHNGPHGFVADGASYEEEFQLRMSEVMLRRTWQDVVEALPAIERTTEVVDINESQAYQIEREAEAIRNPYKRATRVGALARLRRILGKLKVEAAADAAVRVLEGGERVVVWTWHRDVALRLASVLEKHGHASFVVTGDLSPEERDLALARWRSADQAALVITLAVGQVGIDLSAARHTVFAELDFTPAVVAQAEMRVFAVGRPMAATYVVVNHEIDHAILEALQKKCDMSLRLGVPAADTAIDVLASAFGKPKDCDWQDLATAILSDHPDIEDI